MIGVTFVSGCLYLQNHSWLPSTLTHPILEKQPSPIDSFALEKIERQIRRALFVCVICFTLPCIKLILSGIICYIMYVASSSISFASLLATSSDTDEKCVILHVHAMLIIILYLLRNKTRELALELVMPRAISNDDSIVGRINGGIFTARI